MSAVLSIVTVRHNLAIIKCLLTSGGRLASQSVGKVACVGLTYQVTIDAYISRLEELILKLE